MENKTAININDQKLKKVLGKLKVEQQQSKIEVQKVKEELDDGDNNKAFDFVIERKNRKVKLEIEKNKNGESKESGREENEKEAKGSSGFKRAEEENQTETLGSSNKRWSSNTQNIMKETDRQDNKELTSSTGLIMNYQEGYNIPAKEHKINSSEKTDNSIMIYNEITTEVYMDKQERIKPEGSNNHKADRPDIYLDKPKQELQRKDQGEQEVQKTKIRKKIAENGEINVKLVVGSTGKRKTNIENQQDLEKRERNERQYHAESKVQREQ